MPSPPEFADAAGDIGVIKVFEELKPEHSAETYCHIGIAAEIEIDMQCICNDSDP